MEKIDKRSICRQHLMETKKGAFLLFAMDNYGLIDFTGIAERYFERTGKWMLKRVFPHKVNRNTKRIDFTEEEYATMVTAFRDIADKLNETADAIEKGSL